MLAPGLVSGFRLRPEVGLRWPELYSSHAAERQFRSAGVGYFLDPDPRDGAQNHPYKPHSTVCKTLVNTILGPFYSV